VKRAGKRRATTRKATRRRTTPAPSVVRELRAELELLKRKIDIIEAEMRRLKQPIRPAFPDVERDESE